MPLAPKRIVCAGELATYDAPPRACATSMKRSLPCARAFCSIPASGAATEDPVARRRRTNGSVGFRIAGTSSVTGGEDALHGDAEIQRKVRGHVVVRLVATRERRDRVRGE